MTDRFPTDSNFQGHLSKFFFALISLFQLSMYLRTLRQINARKTRVAENLH